MSLDHLSELEELQAKWDAALKGGAFKSASKPISKPVPSSGQSADYGMSPGMAQLAANSEKINDSDYWSAVFHLARTGNVSDSVTPEVKGSVSSEAPELMQEVRKTYPPQQVSPPSFGKDQNPVITPNWIDGKDLLKLNRMKIELHELGDKFAAYDLTGKSKSNNENKVQTQGKEPGADILKKIHDLQNKIDDLSDTLSPGRKVDMQS